MSIQTQDRGDVTTLHALSNGTGTDGTQKRSHEASERGGSQWRRQPTRINAPSNVARPPPNPYSTYNNNLHDSSRRSNPNALSVVPLADGRHPHPHSSASSKPHQLPAFKQPKQNKLVDVDATDFASSVPAASSSTRLSNHSRPGPSTAAPSFQKTNTSNNARAIEVDSKHSNKRRKLHKERTPSPFGPSKQSGVTDVDEEEDIGHVLSQSQSDDAILLRAGSQPPGNPRHDTSVSQILGIPSTPQTHHAFDQKGKQVSAPPPGPNTRILTEAHQEGQTSVSSREKSVGYESDPIQDFNDSEFDTQLLQAQSSGASRSKRKATPSGHTEFPKDIVRERVVYFNHQASRPPEVDLDDKRFRRTSKVGAMKRKDAKAIGILALRDPSNPPKLNKPPQAARGRRKQPDPIATSTTPFQKTGKDHPAEKPILLPIKVWALGTRIIASTTSDDPQPQYWLRSQGKSISVLNAPVENEESLFSYEIGRDINCIELPKDTGEYPLLIFTLREPVRGTPFIDKMAGFDFKGKLSIAIELLKSHANWSTKTYNELIKAWQPFPCGTSYIDHHACRTRWTIVTTGATEPTISQVTKNRPKPRPNYAGVSANEANSSSSTLESQGVRRSARQSSHTARKVDRPPSPSAEETILLYPPTGTGAVNVTHGDLKRLEPGEYLNDTLIEFGLKLWLNELRRDRPSFAEQVHVFSSFFYTQLNQKNLEEGYQSVRKWTSKFDLFKKKYIVVPINEHLHWYLAIICHPERALQQPIPAHVTGPTVITRAGVRESLTNASPSRRSPSSERPTSERSSTSKYDLAKSVKSDPIDEQEVETSLSHQSYVIAETESEGDGSGPADISMEELAARSPRPPDSPELGATPPAAFYEVPNPSFRKKFKALEPREEEDQEIDELADDDAMDVDTISPEIEPGEIEPRGMEEPWIFSFDSLGARHPHALKVLSQYLAMEAKDKKAMHETVSPTTKQALVPAQPNYCDCGVYLLHFVEQFMSEPETFSRHIIEQHKSKKATAANKLTREQLWKHDVVAGRREDMRQKLVSLSSDWKRERKTEGKEKISVERSKTPPDAISVDDSDIEVLEVSAELTRPSKRSQSRAPSSRRAERIR